MVVQIVRHDEQDVGFAGGGRLCNDRETRTDGAEHGSAQQRDDKTPLITARSAFRIATKSFTNNHAVL